MYLKTYQVTSQFIRGYHKAGKNQNLKTYQVTSQLERRDAKKEENKNLKTYQVTSQFVKAAAELLGGNKFKNLSSY